MMLNIERSEVESQLAKYPANSAGRTVAGRKRKVELDERLARVLGNLTQVKTAMRSLRVL